MVVPLIKVRDKETGEEHIVGTNILDALFVKANGDITYRNLKNGNCTGIHNRYEFTDDDYIKFISLGQFIDLIMNAEKEKHWNE